MNTGVTGQGSAKPEDREALTKESASDKELNFRRLEAVRDQEREARIRAEMQTESLMKEIDSIKTMLAPKEKDPLEEIEDIADLDRNKLKHILNQREAMLQKKFDQSLPQRFEEYERNKKRTNFREALRERYSDYDSVMNQDVLSQLPERDAEVIEAISAIEDPYVRCEKAYKYVKKHKAASDSHAEALKQKVEENQTNPYYFPSSQGSSPSAMDFDLNSKSAKEAAYAKLKAAQRKGINNR
jgi:hypothetical protein